MAQPINRGPYEAFAGHECSRALAIMKVEASECNDNLADCSEKQLKTLADWVAKFNSKYTVVGKLHTGEVPEEAYPLLPTSPLPPGLAATMLVVLLLTVVGAYILYLDMLGPPAENAHTEL
ncbi:putative steroid-binding protein 3 [Tetrabaena socialis]|uniref:Putative steroid-binding protein 3 n=1 Tax=Tetrabaena socialis TaxID=47790 RepID=A0A2J7ZNW0_9CHLO|nr:putative steroid-binding protein 3 [Tetrabaena socialis]|eukprot:PNH01940.1 putative steroid-binding protein 3 [Tetrabaena socialis]